MNLKALCAAARRIRLLRGLAGRLLRAAVAARLLWTSAAASFGWTLRQAADSARPTALAEGLVRLTRRTGANARPNPMFDAMRSREQGGEPVPTRRTCCLRYLLPGVADCGSFCPLPVSRRRRDAVGVSC